jgi:hypothetical protein
MQTFPPKIMFNSFQTPTEKRFPELLMRDLEGCSLLVVKHSQHPNQFCFKNAIVREIVYSLLLNSQREQLHSTIAEFLEGHHVSVCERDIVTEYPLWNLMQRLAEYYAKLAHHWKEAHNKAKAVYYLDLYAEQCLNTFDYNLAIELYKKLLDQIDTETPQEKVSKWHRKLGTAYMETSQCMHC